VNVLHHHLETVEASSLGNLDFGAESLGKVFQNNTVRSSEECEDVLDKMLFIGSESQPVFRILAQVNLINGPKGGHLIFIHFPNVLVLDGKDDEAVWVFFQQRLWKDPLCVN